MPITSIPMPITSTPMPITSTPMPITSTPMPITSQGVMLTRAESVPAGKPGKDLMVQLWVHEILRVFYDRLVDEKDNMWMLQLLKKLLPETFDMDFNALMQFCNKEYVQGEPPKELEIQVCSLSPCAIGARYGPIHLGADSIASRKRPKLEGSAPLGTGATFIKSLLKQGQRGEKHKKAGNWTQGEKRGR
eukprot:3003724-Pyramimonas_sp.AAC.1